MKPVCLVLITFLILSGGCSKDNTGITEVKVWDSEFRIIRGIDDPRTLQEFKRIWEDRVEISQHERPAFSHKVDIATARGSQRWLYDPNGYATVLSKAKAPIYRFNNPDRLNEILIPMHGRRSKIGGNFFAKKLPFELTSLKAKWYNSTTKRSG